MMGIIEKNGRNRKTVPRVGGEIPHYAIGNYEDLSNTPQKIAEKVTMNLQVSLKSFRQPRHRLWLLRSVCCVCVNNHPGMKISRVIFFKVQIFVVTLSAGE